MPKYIGICDLCGLRVYKDSSGNEFRKQGGGRPPETPHKHKKEYKVAMPEPESDLYEHGWRGWMDVASRMGAI